MATFIDLARKNKVDLKEIDDYVERWHGNKLLFLPLPIYLGMTDAEYARWVSDPDSLEQIAEARKKGFVVDGGYLKQQFFEGLQAFFLPILIPFALVRHGPAAASDLIHWLL